MLLLRQRRNDASWVRVSFSALPYSNLVAIAVICYTLMMVHEKGAMHGATGAFFC